MRGCRIARSAVSAQLSALFVALFVTLAVLVSGPSEAQAKYAAFVVDANTGAILHAANADTRNYPASLTKMMTLYMAFDAIKRGRWTMDTPLQVSRRAAAQAPSRLGLQPGSTIRLRDAVLALIVKSANDVATVVAENHSKSERDFALRMTAMARQIGMSRTTFRNASGLPNRGQMSTARDMARLAKALMRDFPEFYDLFATKSFEYRGQTYRTHNALLKTYQGADGLKTGYIRASGFNLVTSAERGGHRIIGVVFGGNSSKQRNDLMERLLDDGFAELNVGRAYAEAEPPRKPAIDTTTEAVSAAAARTIAPARPAEADDNQPTGDWGIQVGAYSRYTPAYEMAAKALSQVQELVSAGQIKVVPLEKANGSRLYRARIIGLPKAEAYRACKALERHKINCMELKVKDPLQVAANRTD